MSRYHAMLFPSGPAVADVAALRRAWDPETAAAIGPHITVVYPDEHPGRTALWERIASVADHEQPFQLGLGAFRAFPPPDDGCVFMEAQDLDGGFSRLRDALTAPPFRPIAFPPHLTIIHPRTSNRAAEFWLAGVRQLRGAKLTVESIALTSFEGGRYVTDACVRLGPPSDTAE